jgi:hypothetical protein
MPQSGSAEGFMGFMSRYKEPPYSNWKERRFYETPAWENPENWFYFEHPTHSDWYSKPMAQKFMATAKDVGVDPFDFLAVGISESGLGNLHPSNPARVNWGVHDKFLRGPEDETPERSMQVGALLLKQAMDKYKDRLSALQAYSGTGKTVYPNAPKGQRPKKMFNRPIKEIDFWKEKPQGHRVDEISQLLQRNQAILDLMKSLSTSQERR